MLVCSICNEEKHETEFTVRRGVKRGYTYACKECNTKRARNRYKKNKDLKLKKLIEENSTEGEEWIIDNTEPPSHYFSSKGRVISISNCIVMKLSSRNGYYQYPYKGKTKILHHKIAELFIGERPKGLVIDHINRDRGDNRVENLRYVSYSENLMNRERKGWIRHLGFSANFQVENKRYTKQFKNDEYEKAESWIEEMKKLHPGKWKSVEV